VLCYPEVEIEPCISECSKLLQDYIRQGLKDISAEDADVVVRREEEGHAQDEPHQIEACMKREEIIPREGKESAGQAYLKRLREIQLKYGLPERSSVTQGVQNEIGPNDIAVSHTTPLQPSIQDPSGTSGPGASAGVVDGEKENGLSGRPPVLSVSETRDKATALRERMARIRKASSEQ
jgi:hypothetical protein